MAGDWMPMRWTTSSATSGTCAWIDDSQLASSAATDTPCFTFNSGYKRYISSADDRLVLSAGTELELPDGARLIVDSLGNYRIEDQNAKVTYQANRNREFSPHLNASDMVAQFVDYVRTLGVRQDEVLGLPIGLFINWLIIEAAERDGDPVPEDVPPVEGSIPQIVHPRCLACGRFIPRLHARQRFPFCGPGDAARYVKRLEDSHRRITA